MCLLPGSAYWEWKNQALVQYNDFDRTLPPFLPPFLLPKAIVPIEKPFKKDSFQKIIPEYLDRHHSNILLV